MNKLFEDGADGSDSDEISEVIFQREHKGRDGFISLEDFYGQWPSARRSSTSVFSVHDSVNFTCYLALWISRKEHLPFLESRDWWYSSSTNQLFSVIVLWQLTWSDSVSIRWLSIVKKYACVRLSSASWSFFFLPVNCVLWYGCRCAVGGTSLHGVWTRRPIISKRLREEIFLFMDRKLTP